MDALNTLSPDLGSSLLNAQMMKQKADLQAANEAKTSMVSDVDKAKLKTKSKEFESFFIYQTIELMKPTTDNAFSGGQGEEMFRHTLNEHMASAITDAGGFGISGVIYKELLQQQEQRNTTLANAAKTYTNTPSSKAQ